MRNKKGVIEIQFNWIFVLIAGALILTFFITLVVKQKTTSEISIKARISTDLDAILTGAKVSKGTVNVVDIPKTEIEFYCDRYVVGNARDIGGIIFAPNLIKGTKLITWSLGWNVPYRVSNFLYLTNPKVRYILVGTSSLAQQINLTIPDKINKEFYTALDTVADKNNYKVKFVFFDAIETGDVDISSLSRMPNDDVTAIKVSADSDIDSGEIRFYKKKGSNWDEETINPTYYLGKEALIGAIFSEYKDIEGEKVYDCVMQKAFKRLNLVSQVYTDRSEEIKDTITDTTCISIHNSAYNDLNSVSSEADDLSKNFPSDPSNVADRMSSLKNLNENAQLYSCPLIY